jgi:hypothetical protein
MCEEGLKLLDFKVGEEKIICPAHLIYLQLAAPFTRSFTHQLTVDPYRCGQDRYRFSRDGQTLFASVQPERSTDHRRLLLIYSLTAGRMAASISPAEKVAVSTDGEWLISGDANQTMLWTLQSDFPKQLAYIPLGIATGASALGRNGQHGFRVTADGNQLVVSSLRFRD